jgi:hypothetical protein
MPLDTRAYDTYTEMPDSLESSNIYNLIGINSILFAVKFLTFPLYCSW